MVLPSPVGDANPTVVTIDAEIKNVPHPHNNVIHVL